MRWPKRTLTLKMAHNLVSRAVRLYITNGSLQAWRQLGAHVFLRLTGHSPPTTAILAVTFRCQCSCANCYANAGERDGSGEMSTDEMKSAIDQLKGLGTLLLIFTGGEPLLRKDIYALIAHAHNAGLITRLSTNGWLLTRENVAKLKRAGLNQCGVGISDADPEVHDRERGLPGIFDKAVQGLRYLHEYKLEGKIISYATNRNTPEGLEQIIALGRRLRAKSVYLNFAYAAGRWDDACDEVLSEEKMEQLRKLHDAVFVHLEFPTPERMCCALKKGYIYVNASGDVTPCPVIPFVMGTIKSEQLTEIWKRHVSTLCLELRGICPVNEKKTREALKAHVESVRTGRSG